MGLPTEPPQTITLSEPTYSALRGVAPQPVGSSLLAQSTTFQAGAILQTPQCAPVAVERLVHWSARYAALCGGANPAQLPALLFDATGDPWPLTHFFPLAASMSEPERAEFFAAVAALAAHPHLDLRLMAARRADRTDDLPSSARWLVAGHIVEVLGGRPDILASFLSAPRHIRLYASAQAFADDGGVAGGDYDPSQERIQLGLQRLFEGFSQPLPGVAPFLHEFGHMLDAFVPATGRMGAGRGLLPGLDPADGALFDPDARRLFIAGKRTEAHRYAARVRGDAASEPLPLGHPYVFQTDGEFIAGYLELYFRTPHRFFALNPDLSGAFARLLRRDPRPAWPQDFAYYVTENEAAYLPGRQIAPAGISVPTA